MTAAAADEAGRLLIEARALVTDGWKAWVTKNIDRSYQDCCRVMKMASSPDPHAALTAERAKTRGRIQGFQQGDIMSPEEETIVAKEDAAGVPRGSGCDVRGFGGPSPTPGAEARQ